MQLVSYYILLFTEEVYSLNSTLVDLRNDDRGKDIQNSLSQLLKKMEKSFNSIWPASLSPGNASNSMVRGCKHTTHFLRLILSNDINSLQPTFGPNANIQHACIEYERCD